MSIPGLLVGDPFKDYTPENYFPGHPHTFNLLILGCDSDYIGKRLKTGEAISIPVTTTNGRSDAILVAHYDFDKKTVNVLTIPRDTAVLIPGYSQHDNPHKINAAHQFGGPELTQKTIKEAFGIDTDAYVTLHFEAFQKMVDTVGGVDITVKKPLDYDDNWAHLHIHLKPGLQHLNGYKAMGYVRIRHSDSDLARADRQHEFLESLRHQIQSPKILFQGPALLDALTENLHSNLSTRQMVTLANWSKQQPKENISLVTMPSIEGASYVTCNRAPTRKMVAQIFFDGNEDAVTISTPDKDGLLASSRRGSRRRSRLHPHIETGSDTPLNGDAAGSDTNDAASNSGRSEKPDAAGDEPKSDGDSSPEKKGKDSGGKATPPPSETGSALAQLALLSFA